MTDNIKNTAHDSHNLVPLAGIPQRIWTLLGDAVINSEHPFRTPVIATSNKHGPEARTVVLRGIDAGRRYLECHTDFRSDKISQLTDDDAMTWVFYDAAQKIQVRARSIAQVYNKDEYSHRCWLRLTDYQKRSYTQTLPPGKKIGSSATPPPELNDADPDSGLENFAAIKCCVHEFEWLQLERSGHRRALAVFSDQRWSVQWLMP